jgi:hypothetical protein
MTNHFVDLQDMYLPRLEAALTVAEVQALFAEMVRVAEEIAE